MHALQVYQVSVHISELHNNAPVKLKLQHPPRANPGRLTVHHATGGGSLNVALEGWGN